jgi:hypothetical protein
MVEGALAAYYGRALLAWMQSPTFKIAVGAMAAIAVIGTIVSAIAVYRSTRGGAERPPKRGATTSGSRRTRSVRS